MLSDIEIAQAATLKSISEIASTYNLNADDLIPYGHYIAKLSAGCIQKLQHQPDGKLILVTAISPTPAGEGKTTTTIGLADALNQVLGNRGSNAMVCMREPSLGPVFGLKGGATGGGYAQVLPMEDVNLHFTGDFHAISSANNLLAALIDNHIYQGNDLNIDPASITWRRCIDMNDRALRNITLNGRTKDGKDYVRQTGFDITVASEVMAIFCLATSLDDLQARLGNIQIGLNAEQQPIFSSDLQAEGAMTALLKNAFQPTVVQTLEHTAAIVHGGPFANIAHGCNSVVATKAALKLADYVVTEAGFGADLGAEKFINIKCRKTGLSPAAVVLVATVRALKYHGGVDVTVLNQENLSALKNGMANLHKHVQNLKQHFGLQLVVAINHFMSDTEAEIALLESEAANMGVKAIVCKHWAHGGAGALNLAAEVLGVIEQKTDTFKFLYSDDMRLLKKIEKIAQKIYGASKVELSAAAQVTLAELEKSYNHYPICIAKTQYSFSSDPTLRGAPTGHVLHVRELRLSRGAEFIVAICGDIMTMPGLPNQPASERISVNQAGDITGLS
ncbi:MAG: formate--tetrahydrofolate ligase [Methylotenera sp.]|uniref:formate--tetrahydrofolate ligase n=1 Tax=Methylotenera sp. TaxID=2051956 RepID=UPI0027187C7D|nr:formate--tetrahydrofolate ligase [Methylotenera sp.]MDO9393710.1 formate--tetrahydrofolate ligase [Methylotenera sp.]MDP1522663.1 formate--tetrahydrofolate ligase [Methylotenera sp.]MDP3309290.1 formate--tetrahydrofolate ligase [Methylotenera sp.]MDP3818386.1 formate--tetrahydrofolate ligase [Methylotenera sp.]MDZ4210954.1 formate--tetrahydrofolate ligase [Methylotenera sp.]